MITETLNEHIQDKISYHEKLRKQAEAKEEYEECAKHRDEVIRLKRLLNGE